MARIIYGVSGEGSGHAMRSREVIRWLRQQGHEVKIIGYDRSAAILEPEGEFLKISSFNLAYRFNTVMRLRTVWKSAWRAPKVVKSYADVNRLVEQFKPDLAITDFETITARASINNDVPLVSIDNIHQLTLEKKVPWRYRHDWLIAKTVVKLMVPEANWRFITTLQPPAVEREGITLLPPIIREEIFSEPATVGDHILVYDSFQNSLLPELLRHLPYKFYIYGFNQNQTDGNLRFCEFSEGEYLSHLRSATAVIGTGGFTLMSEALALHKPYLAVPVARQFEQIENGLELTRHGWGQMLVHPDVRGISDFLDNLEEFRARLSNYNQVPTISILQTIGERLEKILNSAKI
jgi:uncharacterized protein (TIGR00661 family)